MNLRKDSDSECTLTNVHQSKPNVLIAEPGLNLLPVVNFFGDQETLALLKGRSPINQTKLQLDFDPPEGNVKIPSYLPIRNNSSKSFDWDEFQSHLTTKSLGRNIIHADLITSTMDLTTGELLKSGLVVIADRQTSGKGRGANKWLSPNGCAMFSLQLDLSLSSGIGKRLPLLLPLVCLAVVDSVNSMGNGYENLDLRLKWPNDIYAGQQCKIGGVLIYTPTIGTSVQANIGVGVNLSNEEPTKCINQMAKEKGLNPISREIFLSQLFNKLEFYLDAIEKNFELNKEIFDKYHKYWLHSDQSVKVQCDDGSMKLGRMVGLDPDGFLLVDVDGHKLKFHPNENSFVVSQGVIIPNN